MIISDTVKPRLNDLATETPSLRDLRAFGWIVGGLTAVFGSFLLPALLGRVAWGELGPVWPLGVGAALALAALVRPTLLSSVYRFWMRLAAFLAEVNTRVLLTLLYLLLIVPMGLLRQRVKRRPLGPSRSGPIRKPRDPIPASQLEKLF